MGMGPRTNLYRIGGDPLTQLNKFNYIFVIFVFFIRNADIYKINEKYAGGDPLTQLIFFNLIIFERFLQKKMNGKYFVGDPLMQSIEHSSLSTALVIEV